MYRTTPTIVAAIAPRENVKRSVVASTGIGAAASTRTARGSRRLVVRYAQKTTPSPTSNPSAFQYVSGKLSLSFATSGDVGQTSGSTLVVSATAPTTTIAAASPRTSHWTRSGVRGIDPNSSSTNR
jgi:hypothetical protein